MAHELRPPADEDEIDAWLAAEAAGFSGRRDPDWEAGERTVLDRERMLGIWEDGRCVGTSGAYPFELTLPGGAALPVAGVCDVGVRPARRRRGLLTEMMTRLHADARARGDAAAVLTASDGSIYRRFGYGIATSTLQWEMDARAALHPGPEPEADADLLFGDEAVDALTELWERTRTRLAGTLSRPAAWWALVVGPKEQWKGGGDVHSLVLRDRSGSPVGAAVHRIHFSVDRGVQAWRVEVLDLFGVSDEIEARLWRELGQLDHVASVSVRVRPVDDPIRWRLQDPRQMKVSAVVDLLWLCPLDVVRLLEARTYGTDGQLVLRLDDPLGDERISGTYRLEVEAGAGRCERVDGIEPDLHGASSALGQVLLGGTTFGALAAAGRLEVCRPDRLAAADALFATSRAPFNSTFF